MIRPIPFGVCLLYQLNGAPGFFNKKQRTTYFDSHFSVEPQSARERRRKQKAKLHTWRSAVRD